VLQNGIQFNSAPSITAKKPVVKTPFRQFDRKNPGPTQNTSCKGDAIQLYYQSTEEIKGGRYPSGQRGQTVNLLAYAYAGSNPALPTTLKINGLGLTKTNKG
jgi:hypothetical protein